MDKEIVVHPTGEKLVLGDEQLLREAVVALRDRVHAPADRTCCPDCADDADAIDLITKLQERLLNE